MNYFKERLSLYLNGLANVNKVLESRWNRAKQQAGILSPAIEAEALRRYDICQECPFNSLLAQKSAEYYSLYKQNYETTRDPEDFHCAVCSCPIEYKVLSMASNCGLEAWNQTHMADEQLPLKWASSPNV